MSHRILWLGSGLLLLLTAGGLLWYYGQKTPPVRLDPATPQEQNGFRLLTLELREKFDTLSRHLFIRIASSTPLERAGGRLYTISVRDSENRVLNEHAIHSLARSDRGR
ncbi:MAG: hypothetical protein NZM28_06230, partial [Fimbriimonadales bacterium]|nr:hypothetical protein [Fimbriimonadales bacterium]